MVYTKFTHMNFDGGPQSCALVLSSEGDHFVDWQDIKSGIKPHQPVSQPHFDCIRYTSPNNPTDILIESHDQHTGLHTYFRIHKLLLMQRSTHLHNLITHRESLKSTTGKQLYSIDALLFTDTNADALEIALKCLYMGNTAADEEIITYGHPVSLIDVANLIRVDGLRAALLEPVCESLGDSWDEATRMEEKRDVLEEVSWIYENVGRGERGLLRGLVGSIVEEMGMEEFEEFFGEGRMGWMSDEFREEFPMKSLQVEEEKEGEEEGAEGEGEEEEEEDDGDDEEEEDGRKR